MIVTNLLLGIIIILLFNILEAVKLSNIKINFIPAQKNEISDEIQEADENERW